MSMCVAKRFRLFKKGKAMTGLVIAKLTISSTTLVLALCMFFQLVKRTQKSTNKTDIRVDTTTVQLAEHSEKLTEISAELKEVQREQSNQSQRLTTVETDLKSLD